MIEIRRLPEGRHKGDVDEIVAKDSSFHLEVMDYDHVWMEVYDYTGKRIMVNLHAARRTDGGLKIDINVEDD